MQGGIQIQNCMGVQKIYICKPNFNCFQVYLLMLYFCTEPQHYNKASTQSKLTRACKSSPMTFLCFHGNCELSAFQPHNFLPCITSFLFSFFLKKLISYTHAVCVVQNSGSKSELFRNSRLSEQQLGVGESLTRFISTQNSNTSQFPIECNNRGSYDLLMARTMAR